MDGAELRQYRTLERAMTQYDFGVWLAAEVNAARPKGTAEIKPYTPQRIADWEAGRANIPAKAELVIRRLQLEAESQARQAVEAQLKAEGVVKVDFRQKLG